MSQAKFLIVVLIVAAAIGAKVWITSLEEQLTKATEANASLSASLADKTSQLATERKAAIERDAAIKTLTTQVAKRTKEYNEKTSKDTCANSTVPDSILILMH